MNRKVLIGGAVLALPLLALLVLGLGRDPHKMDSPLVGRAAPPFALKPAGGGEPVSLESLRGKTVVVNFWATWCAPCREEMPEFVRAQTEFGPKGLQFVGIAVDQPDKVRQFATEIGLNYPSLIGGFGAMELSKSLGNSVMALPFSVVIDRQGNVVHTQLGILKPQKLDSIVRQLL